MKIQTLVTSVLLLTTFNLSAKTILIKLNEASNPQSSLILPKKGEGFYRATSDLFICKIPEIFGEGYNYVTREIKFNIDKIAQNEFRIEAPISIPGLCKFKLVTVDFAFTTKTTDVNPIVTSKNLQVYFDEIDNQNEHELSCQNKMILDVLLENLTDEERARIPADQEIRNVNGLHFADLLCLTCDPENNFGYSFPAKKNNEPVSIKIKVE